MGKVQHPRPNNLIKPASWPVAIFSCCLLLSCAALRPSLTPPEHGGPLWREVRSNHILLHTDLDEGGAREVGAEFERSYTLVRDLAGIFFPAENEPDEPVEVVVFERSQDFHFFAPPWSGGLALSRVLPDEDVQQIVLRQQFDGRARSVFQHEVTHRLLHRFTGAAPPWLDEGLAEYLSTLRAADGVAIYGAPPPERGFRTDLDEYRVDSRPTTIVPIDELPSVRELVRADRKTFYDKDNVDRYYAGAWVLVHLLATNDATRARFREYIGRLARGEGHVRAWAACFGYLTERDEKSFERTYRSYATGVHDLLQRRYNPVPPDRIVQTGFLDPVEVHLLWARLLPWNTPKQIAAVRSQIDAAFRVRKEAADAYYYLASLDLTIGRLLEAEAEASHAASLRPEEERFWRLLVIVRGAVARAKDPRNPDLSTADLAVQRLLGLPRLSLGRTIVAQYYLRLGQLDLALAEAEQAALGKSDCRRCFQVLARVYAARGNFRAALAAAERVTGLLPYGSEVLE